jgi:Glycine zipper
MKKFIFVLSLTFTLTILSSVLTRAEAQKVKEVHKTGWSHKKKNAVIGGGAGAVTGALVSKNHAKGAVVGGAVGAGAGYLLGRHQDKKTPPKKVYKYKKAA